MWPWEHLAFAYVCYSLLANAVRRTGPSTRETVAVVVGSQFADLVDKPLAWTIGFTETGYSVAHSVFVAPVVVVAAYAVAIRRGDRVLADAFAVAYGSHLVADVWYPMVRGLGPWPHAVLWPVSSPPVDDRTGLLEHFFVYVVRYVHELTAGGVTPVLALQFVLAGAVLTLWLFDGAPIAADVWRWLRGGNSSSP